MKAKVRTSKVRLAPEARSTAAATSSEATRRPCSRWPHGRSRNMLTAACGADAAPKITYNQDIEDYLQGFCKRCAPPAAGPATASGPLRRALGAGRCREGLSGRGG